MEAAEGHLRDLQKADIDLLVAWEKTRPYPWTANHFSDTLQSSPSRTLILEKDRHVEGFAVVQRIEREAYLLNIMVNPGKRRQGRGRFLLENVLTWCRAQGADTVFLDVDPANEAALRLYCQVGFERVAKRIRAYPRGEEALLMRRTL